MEFWEKAQTILVCLGVGVAICLVLAAEAYVQYRVCRYRNRLARDGVRVPGIVTRVRLGFTGNPSDVSVRYTLDGATEPIERWFDWANPRRMPAVGDTVTMVYLPGVWRSADLEANVV